MNAQNHWEKIYQENAPTDVSWYQQRPVKSLELISQTGVSKESTLIDVGGGASLLVDSLLDAGFKRVSVLDISAEALGHARRRLADRAETVEWLQADVTSFVPEHPYALWHDRAVFHFLVIQEDRANYLRVLKRTLVAEGHLIMSTFAEDGPTRCSGRPVVRYGSKSIAAELGADFCLVNCEQETHVTPWSTEQRFNWFSFRFRPRKPAKGTEPETPHAKTFKPNCSP